MDEIVPPILGRPESPAKEPHLLPRPAYTCTGGEAKRQLRGSQGIRILLVNTYKLNCLWLLTT
jgi:hypothetical protein